MEDARQEKLKISNDLLDAMLVGVKTQDDLCGKDGIIQWLLVRSQGYGLQVRGMRQQTRWRLHSDGTA